MRRRPRLVGLLWRWHRRLGVIAAFFALVLAVSGVVLNHAAELRLEQRFVAWPWLVHAYGDDSADLPAFQLGELWLSRAANGRVYFDAREVAPCSGGLVGAVQSGELFYAACADELLVVTARGQLVESVNASTGLPVPVAGIGLAGSSVALRSSEGWWLADVDVMDFSRPVPGGALISELAPGELPPDIRNEIPAPEQWLSWERVLLDLHSGRIAGRAGVLWVDAVGVLLGCLAISGIAMWWLHRRRGRRQRGVERSAPAGPVT
jgi:hypothetical protein